MNKEGLIVMLRAMAETVAIKQNAVLLEAESIIDLKHSLQDEEDEVILNDQNYQGLKNDTFRTAYLRERTVKLRETLILAEKILARKKRDLSQAELDFQVGRYTARIMISEEVSSEDTGMER